MQNGIYFDNSMKAKPSEKAISEMMPWLLEKWGAPESLHSFGALSMKGVKEGLSALYTLLNASLDDTIVFTSSGAEAVNQVMNGIFYTYIQESGRNHILVSGVDELPGLMAGKRLEELGCSCKALTEISKKAIEAAITPRTILLSLSVANGLTGIIYPIQEIAELCRDRGIFLHIDITHAIGKVFLDLKTIDPSFITFRGEPLHAPSGTGALFIKSGVKASPFILGGKEQGGLRGGSFSVPNLMALSVAAKELMEAQDFMATEVARIRMVFEDALLEWIPGTKVLFIDEERVPHVTAIAFPGVSSELLLYHLNHAGIFASIGGGDFQPLPQVLKACRVPQELAETAISFSFARTTTEEDVLKAASLIKAAYVKLQGISRVFHGI